MEETPTRDSKILEIMNGASSLSRKIVTRTLISCLNKARALNPTEQPLDVDEDEDELVELELVQLVKPIEQPIDVSGDENEPNTAKNNEKLTQTFFLQIYLINIKFIKFKTSE